MSLIISKGSASIYIVLITKTRTAAITRVSYIQELYNINMRSKSLAATVSY